MKIHAIQTGTVQVKSSQCLGRGWGMMRQFHVLFDRAWTEPLPIYAWAIETDEGAIVVDSGESAKTSQRNYFPWWHPYFRLAVRVDVTQDQEIGRGLLEIGIRPDDVRTVILTHLHTDHVGGIHHFPNSEILVRDNEYQLAKGFMGRLRGYLPNRWPTWFSPKTISFQHNSIGPFDRSYPVTRDGKVVIVPTQGHTAGQTEAAANPCKLGDRDRSQFSRFKSIRAHRQCYYSDCAERSVFSPTPVAVREPGRTFLGRKDRAFSVSWANPEFLKRLGYSLR